MLPNKVQHNQKHLIGYGTFSSTVSTIPITTTSSPLSLNVNEEVFGGAISHDIVTNNSRIYFNKRGIYSITYSHQLSRVGGSSHDAVFYLRQNGNQTLRNSASRIFIGNPNSHDIVTAPFVKSFISGDYIECMAYCAGNDEYSLLTISGSGTNSTEIPVSPAIILTVEGYGF